MTCLGSDHFIESNQHHADYYGYLLTHSLRGSGHAYSRDSERYL